jgi:hypothetical protein
VNRTRNQVTSVAFQDTADRDRDNPTDTLDNFAADKVKHSPPGAEDPDTICIPSSGSTFATSISSSPDFPDEIKNNCQAEFAHFEKHVNQIITDLQQQKSRTAILQTLLGDRKSLVGLRS